RRPRRSWVFPKTFTLISQSPLAILSLAASSFPLQNRYSHWTWWIIQTGTANSFWAGFWSVGSPERRSHSRLRSYPTSSAGSFTTLPMTGSSNRTRLTWLSSGNGQQGAREDLARRPFSMGSAGCHGWCPLPIALRQKLASSCVWLHEWHSQRGMRPHKVIVGSPSLEVGEQV